MTQPDRPIFDIRSQAAPSGSLAGIDLPASRRRFDRAAQHWCAARSASQAEVQGAPAMLLDQEVAQRMAQRLDWVRIEPARILDAGCGGGDGQALLHQRYPQASWLGVDSSHAMLEWARAKFDGGSFGNYFGNSTSAVRRQARWPVVFSAGLQRLRAWLQRRPGSRNGLLCADISALPLQSSSVGLVWSNLALPWVHDLAVGLRELHRVLEPGGLLTFSSYGPDTLKELRSALNGSGERGERAAQQVHPFMDMHDLGDQLLQTGFAAPVMDMEIIRLSWPDAAACLRELHHSGQGNALRQRPRGLQTPRTWRLLCQRLQREAGDADGRVSLSFEIVYGHAWRGQPRKSGQTAAQPAVQPKVIRFQARPGTSQALF